MSQRMFAAATVFKTDSKFHTTCPILQPNARKYFYSFSTKVYWSIDGRFFTISTSKFIRYSFRNYLYRYNIFISDIKKHSMIPTNLHDFNDFVIIEVIANTRLSSAYNAFYWEYYFPHDFNGECDNFSLSSRITLITSWVQII